MLTLVNSRGILLSAILASGVRTVWHPHVEQSRRIVSQPARRSFFLMRSMRHILPALRHRPDQRPAGRTRSAPRGRSRTVRFTTESGRLPVPFAPTLGPRPAWRRIGLDKTYNRHNPSLAQIERGKSVQDEPPRGNRDSAD